MFIGSYGGVSSATIGEGSGGAFERFDGTTATVTTNASEQTIITNFVTTGGSGSGGGAGLGGAFFVDQDGQLTLNSVVLSGNSVTGGEGGSLPALRFGDVSTLAAPISRELIEIDQLLATPVLIADGAGGYSFASVDLGDIGTDLYDEDTPVVFDTLAVSAERKVTGKTDQVIGLDSAVSLSAGDILSVTGEFVEDPDGDPGTSDDIAGYTVSGDSIDFSNVEDTERDAIADAVQIGSQVFIGTSGAKVTALEYDDSGNLEALQLDQTIGTTTGQLDLITVASFKARQFDLSGSTINVTGALRGFEEGMMLYDSDGNALGATITSVAADGDSFTVDNPGVISGVYGFEARLAPLVSATELQLNSATSDIYVGAQIRLEEIDTTVEVAAYDEATGLVTFTNALTTTAQNTLADMAADGDALNLTIQNVTSAAGTSITLRDTGLAFEEGMEIEGGGIADGTTIVSVSASLGGFITLTLSDSVTGDVDAAIAKSPLSRGGSLNGMSFTNSSGSNGGDGVSANLALTIFNEGEGVEGTRGYAGDDGDGAQGFDGGVGGNGSDGIPYNPAVVKALFDGGVDLTLAGLDLAGAISPDPVVGLAVPIPDPVEIIAKTFGLGKAIGDLGEAIAESVLWGIQLSDGLAGLGGDGGEGGEGGGGSEFFGGGAGGSGGDGGSGALAFTDGGNGGDGGRGGNGAFGAGGGGGGAGGEAGANGAADDGDPGDGGFAGFGAGEGSNGDGLYGDGGSGFGGSIFVRDGGQLTVTGDSVFQNNDAAGGSSNNSGSAGDGAGNAIFLMKGASVRLTPGQGSTIRIEDDIADNSAASYEGAEYAEGAGADLTISGTGGVVQLNGENTYSGDTIIESATLEVELGVGVHDSSRIRFAGTGQINGSGGGALSTGTTGTLLLSENLTERRAGTAAFEIMWTGSGGFASSNEDGIRITLGETLEGVGQDLVWGENGFFEEQSPGDGTLSKTLTFGSEFSQGTVTFTNNVDFTSAGAANIGVYQHADPTVSADASTAVLSGDWTGGTLSIGDGNTSYVGRLFMTGENAVDTLDVLGGTLSTAAVESGGDAGRMMAAAADLTVHGGAVVNLAGAEDFASVTVLAPSPTSVGALSLRGATTLTGAMTNAGIVLIDGETPSTGSLSTGAEITNSAEAIFTHSGEVSVGTTLSNDGTWIGTADITSVGGALTNTSVFGLVGDIGTADGISNTGATASFMVEGDATSVGGINNEGNWVLEGDATATAAISNTGVWDQIGDTETMAALTTTNSWTQEGDTSTVGNLTNSGLWDQEGATSTQGTLSNSDTWLQTGATTATGSIDSNGTWSQDGDTTTGGGLTVAGTWAQMGDTTATAAISNTGVWDQIGDTETMAALTTTNSWTQEGDTSAVGNLTNSGLWDQEGATSTQGTLSNSDTWLQTGATTATGSIDSNGTWSQDGDTTTGGGLTVAGTWTQSGDTTATAAISNTGVWDQIGDTETMATLTTTNSWTQEGDTSAGGNLTNSGLWDQEGATSTQGTLSNSDTWLQTGATTATGSIDSNGTWSQDGDTTTGGGLTVAGTWTQSGDTTATAAISNTGVWDQIGDTETMATLTTTNSWTQEGDTSAGGNLTNSGLWDQEGATSTQGTLSNSDTWLQTGATTATGSIDSNGTWSQDGDTTTGGGLTVAGTWTQSGDTTATAAISNTGVWDQIGDTETMATLTTTNSWTQEGDTSAVGNLTNSGLWDQEGETSTQGTLSNSDEWVQLGDTYVGVDWINVGDWDQTGTLTIDGAGSNSGSTIVGGAITVGTTFENTATGDLSHAGPVDIGGILTNDGFWRAETDTSLSASQLQGAASGMFCLESVGSTPLACDVAGATGRTLTLSLTDADPNMDSDFAGVFAGAGNLIKQGADTLSLTAAQTFKGDLTIENGGVTLTNAGTLSDTTNVIVRSGASYAPGVDDTIASLTVDAGGTTRLDADLVMSGQAINNGTISMTEDRTIVSAGLAGGNTGHIEIDQGYTFTSSQTGDSTYAGTFAGGSFIKAGVGTLTFGGTTNSLITESITILGGVLAFDGEQIIDANADVTVSSNGTLLLINGDQSINTLDGNGLVEIGDNDLTLDNGGAFTGQVIGTGDIGVSGGIFDVPGTVVATTSNFHVADGSTNTISGTLDVQSVLVDGAMVLNGAAALVKTPTTVITGMLQGTGEFEGAVQMSNTGEIAPGQSPGILTFNTLDMSSGGLLSMEIGDPTQVAGVGFDQIVTTGTFTVSSATSMDILELAQTNPVLGMGETVNLLNFAPGSFSGHFGDVSSNIASVEVFNLATGNAVGTGSMTLADIRAMATSPEQSALFDALVVEDTGGVSQFYGGEFIEDLTGAIASGVSTDTVFDSYSPASYGSLLDTAQSAAGNALPSRLMGYQGQKATFLYAERDVASTNGTGADAFGLSVNTFGVGVSAPIGESFTGLVSLNQQSGSAEGDYTDSTSSGLAVSAAVFGSLGMDGSIWSVGVSHSDLEASGTRRNLTQGALSFDDVDLSATQLRFGVEMERTLPSGYLRFAGGLSIGQVKMGGFSETTVAADGLNTMQIRSAKESYQALDLRVEVGRNIAPMTDFYGAIDVLASSRDSSITGRFDQGQVDVTSNPASALSRSGSLEFGIRRDLEQGGQLGLGIGVGQSFDGDVDTTASFSLNLKF